MTEDELIGELIRRRITLRPVEGNRIEYSAPRDALDGALRSAIIAHRHGLVRTLISDSHACSRLRACFECGGPIGVGRLGERCLLCAATAIVRQQWGESRGERASR